MFSRWLFYALAGSIALAVCATAADSAPEEKQFLSNVRQLIYEGKRSGEGYFSADGKSLVFQSEREADNPFYQIYLLDLESGDIKRASTGTGKTTCAFLHPHKDEILFASTHQDKESKAKQKAELDFRASGKTRRYSWDYDEHYDIFVAKRDGSGMKRITDAIGYDAEGSYSPDGRKIAFCSVRDAYPIDRLDPKLRQRAELDISYFGEIYVMNADGSEQKRLTTSPGYDGGPFFSPDGQRIIWRRFNEEGTIADIYTMKLDGSEVRRLTDFGSMSWAPYYHPSGKYVVFASNKHGFGNFEVFMVDAEGAHEPVRVTHTDGFDGLPVFSPDGTKLCWTSGRTSDGKSQLFMADWNHPTALATIQRTASRSKSSASGDKPRPSLASASVVAGITTNDLHTHVAFLASDSLDGRLTGTKGAQEAAEYIAQQLKAAGLEPFGKNITFLQPFEFTSGVKVVTNQNRLSLATHGENVDFEVDKDFRPLSFTANGEVEGDVVFAGYGLTVPGKGADGYDSYAGLNVSNKIVMVLRYVPEGVDQKRRQELNRYAGLRYKALIARTQGARALLIVTGPNSPNPGSLAPLTFDTSLSGSGIVAGSISADVANTLLIGSGKTLKELQTSLDTENPHVQHGLPLPGMRLKVATSVQHIKKTDHNVVGVLPPGPGSTEYVMLGAHYDHLGHGETGGFGIKGEEGQIHNGADDNASGVAAMLELAATFAAERKQRPSDFSRGVIFSFWSGEELGLIGSSYFAEHPPVSLTNVVAYLNFDMVGRLRDNKLTLQGIGSSAIWKKLIEKRNVAAGFSLTLQDDPYLPTDTTAFYPKGIPVLAFFTGSHENYHRPADDIDTLNYDGMERITKFARTLTLDLVKTGDRPDYVKVERASTGGGGRDAMRAYLGTIPDYATDVQGVKLSGARGGSPADKAGVKAGDVIVEFAGQKIANIYDYTYALDAVKIGVPVKVIVMRDGKRVELTVTPETRK